MMIISCSRRTDIPAFFSDWLMQRIREGFVLVRNPINVHQVSKIPLHREAVDCFVFWTKNPGPMLEKLPCLDHYPSYFQFTLNPYEPNIESGLPRKETLAEIFKKLSDRLGPRRVIWRYDPILINDDLDAGYHEESFGRLANQLRGYTAKCVISFVDYYRKIDKNYKKFGLRETDDSLKRLLASKISTIAHECHMTVESCAESIDLSEQGVNHGKCIDPVLIEELVGQKVACVKDPNQREHCGCMVSVDIGAYDTCSHGCIYCYANSKPEKIKGNLSEYDAHSPLLCGKLSSQDIITEREMPSCVLSQTSFLE